MVAFKLLNMCARLLECPLCPFLAFHYKLCAHSFSVFLRQALPTHNVDQAGFEFRDSPASDLSHESKGVHYHSWVPPTQWSRCPQEDSTLSSWVAFLTGGRVWESSSSLWKPRGQQSCDTALPQATWRRPDVKIEGFPLQHLLPSVLKPFVLLHLPLCFSSQCLRFWSARGLNIRPPHARQACASELQLSLSSVLWVEIVGILLSCVRIHMYICLLWSDAQIHAVLSRFAPNLF